ncbi:hypothetical protein BGZ57DRAFT_1007406 [Hyaloscypha finlandica]|nr:hypothetical protein BGZ57DRAFT_1007406 [Hyaloscypha finlandica]
MHFKHRITPENTSTFVQKLVESSPLPASSNQAKLVGQGAGFLHRKLSEKAKHHSTSWHAKIEETAKRHVEKHVPYPHSSDSTTEMLAASSAAAGFAHHASTFPIAKDDQHAYNAPTSREESSDDQSQTSFTEHDQPNANFGPQASGVVTANEAQDGRNSWTVAGELAAESLAFVRHGDSCTSNFAPQTNHANHLPPVQTRQNPTAYRKDHHRPIFSNPASSLPPQLQIRPNISTPPSQHPHLRIQHQIHQPTPSLPALPKDIIGQLDAEGFFNPNNIAFLPSQLEVMLKKQGVVSTAGGRVGVTVPACMPDELAFGGGEVEGGSHKEAEDDDASCGEGEGAEGSEAEGEREEDEYDDDEYDEARPEGEAVYGAGDDQGAMTGGKKIEEGGLDG